LEKLGLEAEAEPMEGTASGSPEEAKIWQTWPAKLSKTQQNSAKLRKTRSKPLNLYHTFIYFCYLTIGE